MLCALTSRCFLSLVYTTSRIRHSFPLKYYFIRFSSPLFSFHLVESDRSMKSFHSIIYFTYYYNFITLRLSSYLFEILIVRVCNYRKFNSIIELFSYNRNLNIMIIIFIILFYNFKSNSTIAYIRNLKMNIGYFKYDVPENSRYSPFYAISFEFTIWKVREFNDIKQWREEEKGQEISQ